MVTVEPADVVKVLPPTSATQPPTAYLATLISQAVTRLKMHVPELDRLTGANPDKAQFAQDMVINAVLRVVRNPAAAEGYQSESEGGYSYSVASALEASANIWFPDNDLKLLRPASATVGSIPMSRPVRNW